MLYLDANAFYWFLGRDNLSLPKSVPNIDINKYQEYLRTHISKSLPASVFMEIIVHFRDNPTAIRKIVSFIEKEKIQIYNNFQGYCFTSDELTALHITIEDRIFTQYAYKLLDKKIEIETQHSYVFLQTVSLMYADYYLKSCATIDEETSNKILSYLGIDLSNELKDDYMTQLVNCLKDGYSDNNKSQQYLKKKYVELLTQNCVIYQMIIDTMVKFLEDEEDLYNVMCKSASKAKANGFTDDKIMEIIVKALANDSLFLQEAKSHISDIFFRKGYSKHQAEYMKVLLEAWLERGQKLLKNDIFDMLYVGSADKIITQSTVPVLIDQSSYLVSFDKALMNYIGKNNWNRALLNKFLLPEYQLQN